MADMKKKKAPTRNVTPSIRMNATNGNVTQGARIAHTRRKTSRSCDIAGSWKTDKATESAMVDQDLVDEHRWR